MEEYYPLLAATPLFADIPPEGLDRLLGCFAPAVRRYEKGDILLLAGAALVAACTKELDEAEQRVVKLRAGAGGEPVEEPFGEVDA